MPVVADLNPKTLDNAKRQFVELYGGPLLLNRYLQIGLGLSLAFTAGLLVLNFRTQAQAAHIKPLVIRINDVGRADVIDYDATTYRPQAPELRYFLIRFIVTHFSRLRATVQRDYPDSLFFFAPALADATIASNDRTHVLELFLKDATADDIDVTVKNVTLTELTTQRPTAPPSTSTKRTTLPAPNSHASKKRTSPRSTSPFATPCRIHSSASTRSACKSRICTSTRRFNRQRVHLGERPPPFSLLPTPARTSKESC